MPGARQKLIGLLDYVEQVIRLDERVAFRLPEYRLPDGTTFAVRNNETQNLPGVRNDHRDEEGPVWLEVERLARKEPRCLRKTLPNGSSYRPIQRDRPRYALNGG
jgi:hypothetical protein